MSQTFHVTLQRGDEISVEVDASCTYAGRPARGPSYASGGEPAEGPEFEINSVTHAGVPVELSADEEEIVYEHVEINWDWYDG